MLNHPTWQLAWGCIKVIFCEFCRMSVLVSVRVRKKWMIEHFLFVSVFVFINTLPAQLEKCIWLHLYLRMFKHFFISICFHVCTYSEQPCFILVSSNEVLEILWRCPVLWHYVCVCIKSEVQYLLQHALINNRHIMCYVN